MNISNLMIFFVISFFYGLASIQAASRVSTIESFNASSVAIANRLIQQGTESIAGVDLRKLKADIASGQFPVQLTSRVNHPEGKLGSLQLSRQTAMWFPLSDGRVQILVNPLLWDRADQESREILSLHEHLGHRDQQYILSTGLWLLSRNEMTELLQPQEKATVVALISQLSSGGATGVGGGGDLTGIQTKTRLLKAHLKLISKSQERHERAQRMRGLLVDLQSINEVSRDNSDRTVGEIHIASREAQRDLITFDNCTHFLKSSENSKRRFYQLLVDGRPDLQAQWPSRSVWQRYCLKVLAGASE